MRKAIITILILSALAACVYAAGAGSEDDPLVSKSYVDEKIASLTDLINKSDEEEGQKGSSESFEAISVDAGKSLIGGAGTEIILRSGEASAIDNGANGVSDVTEGSDLMSGDHVSANHLLLTPRDDGRGIAAKTMIWVLVRGDYSIV